MRYDDNRSLALLRIGTDRPDARFRPGQQEAIRALVEGGQRLLVVQRTGWGKSFVYFIATRLLRDAGLGPALIVSPLLSLMRNQIAAAARMGVRAERITSDNEDAWPAIEAELRDDAIDVLLIAPERMANERFRSRVLGDIADRVALLVIDEAHCISDWGHDFRPHYRLIERTLSVLPRNLRLIATTATANDRVLDDLRTVLGTGSELKVFRGPLHRRSLYLQTIRMASQAERLAWLADQIPRLPGSGIVYTLTVRDAEQVAKWLRSQGIDAAAYSGKTGAARPEIEEDLLANRVKALVATTALGMGFDKPDLGFVIHYQTPGSVVAYYQQVGRAGRGAEAAYGVLLSGSEDLDITDYFIRRAFPTRDEVESVLVALESVDDGLTLSGLERSINVARGRIEKALLLLSLESPAPIVKEGTRWQLTAAPLGEAFWQRAERLTELRCREQQEMQAYVRLASEHMAFLVKALDGSPSEHASPDLPPLDTKAHATSIRAAVRFLRRTGQAIRPRKQWPPDGMPAFGCVGRRIAAAHQAQPGRTLAVWGDAGWGELIRRGKYHVGRFDDELVDACVELIDRWRPEPPPTWVTAIPSLRHLELVPGFARRLADALGLEFQRALVQTLDRPAQKKMANSTHQARNLDGSMRVVKKPLPIGPVLLVDDMVDSRWTLTVAAWLLRSSGSDEVWPLALASSRSSA